MQRVLSNPQDYEYGDLENEQFYNQIPKEQLGLRMDGKKRRLWQILSGIHQKLVRRSDLVEVSPLWNTGVYAFSIVTFIFNILLTLSVGIIKFNQLPRKIPLFYESINSTWTQVDKSLIFIIPIFLIAFFIVQVRLIGMIFVKDRRLATIILWITTLLNILFLIAITQTYRLIT